MSQELPAWGPVRATLFFNVKNLGNLLDSDWGQVYTASFDGESIANIENIDNGVYELDFFGAPRFFTSRSQSQWRAQLGFRLDW